MTGLRAFMTWTARSSKRIAVTLVGAVLLGAGLVMLLTPGPGGLALIAGLAVLGTEYAWAKRALASARSRAAAARDRLNDRQSGRAGRA